MNKEIIKYLSKFKQKKLDPGLIHEDESFLKIPSDAFKHENISKFLIGGKPYYMKDWQDTASIYGMASGDMYRTLNIAAPKEYIVKRDSPKSKYPVDEYSTISKDIKSVPHIIPVIAGRALKFALWQIKEPRLHTKLAIINDLEVRNAFLSIMTPKCLDELIGITLLDELRTDTDRHGLNYFLYKTSEDGLFEGVITFDLNHTQIVLDEVSSKEDFSKFIKNPYWSFKPTQCLDADTYSNRVNNILEVIRSGMVPNSVITLLRNALEYDFPARVKSLCEITPEFTKLMGVYEGTSRLWEYNRRKLGNELEL